MARIGDEGNDSDSMACLLSPERLQEGGEAGGNIEVGGKEREPEGKDEERRREKGRRRRDGRERRVTRRVEGDK